jgi:hypothetical protein
MQLLLDDIQSSKPSPRELSWARIYNEMPQYAHIVKPTILACINDTTYMGGIAKCSMLYDIVEKQGSAFFPDLLELTRSCPDHWVRGWALFYLVKMGYPNSLELLKERFIVETDTLMKWDITDSLIFKYGSFDTYVFVKNNLTTVFNPVEWQYMIKLIQKDLKRFVPPKPSGSSTTGGLLDTLIILVGNVQSQNWLGNTAFITELNTYLTNAKSNLNAGNQIGSARQIKTFQQAVDQEYRDSLDNDGKFVTKEGWKFLYYNAQYILDRLPQIPPGAGSR